MYKSCYKADMQSFGVLYTLATQAMDTWENRHAEHVDQIKAYFGAPRGNVRAGAVIGKEEMTVSGTGSGSRNGSIACNQPASPV